MRSIKRAVFVFIVILSGLIGVRHPLPTAVVALLAYPIGVRGPGHSDRAIKSAVVSDEDLAYAQTSRGVVRYGSRLGAGISLSHGLKPSWSRRERKTQRATLGSSNDLLPRSSASMPATSTNSISRVSSMRRSKA